MTEKRLIEIKQNIIANVSPVIDDLILLAMKQAVNEVLDEAVNSVDFTDETYSSLQEGSTVDVDKQTIFCLKVK